MRATCTAVGADKMGDAHADSAIFFAFFARVAFGFAITLLFVILAINLLSTCNPRAYSQREVGRYLAIIVRTCSSRLLCAHGLDSVVHLTLRQLWCPDTKCLPAPLRLACLLCGALFYKRTSTVDSVVHLTCRQLWCPDAKCLLLRWACCLWGALLCKRASIVGAVPVWYSCTSFQFLNVES